MNSGWENRESISNLVNMTFCYISEIIAKTQKHIHTLCICNSLNTINVINVVIIWQNLSLVNKKRYVKMNPWRSEEDQREREVMRVEKDRQLKARLMEEENLDKKRYIRQFQEGLQERKMEDSFLKVSEEDLGNQLLSQSLQTKHAFTSAVLRTQE